MEKYAKIIFLEDNFDDNNNTRKALNNYRNKAIKKGLNDPREMIVLGYLDYRISSFLNNRRAINYVDSYILGNYEYSEDVLMYCLDLCWDNQELYLNINENYDINRNQFEEIIGNKDFWKC